jgi:K+-transporting ATPase KdpF subunit
MSASVSVCGEGNVMSAESIVMLVISALTTVYLFYALLRPEKF